MATKYVMPAATSPLIDSEGRLTPVWLAYFRAIEDLSRHIKSGIGTPEGVVAADIGTLFLREDGGASTTVYVKEANSGAVTGWVAK